jgi:PAS domain S-box-containing protein
MRSTLALAFFSLCALVLLVYGGIKILQDVGRHEVMLAGRQHLAAREAATAVSQFVNESFQILETAIWMSDLHAESETQQRQILRRLLGLWPAFRHLMVLDADNRVQARSSRLSRRATEGRAHGLKTLESGQFPLNRRMISPVYIDPGTYEPMVTLAVPVTDVFGDIQGALVAELNLKFMWEVVDRLQVGRGGYAYVADRRGSLLAFRDTGRVLKAESLAHIEAVGDFMARPASVAPQTATRYRGILGTMVLGSYVPLASPDWAVVAEMPWQEAYGDILWDVAAAAGITLVLALLAGGAGTLLARRLAAPVIDLTGTACRVAAGELDLKANVAGPSEVAGLAMAFNSMTERLRGSLTELEGRYADLARTEEALRHSEERLRLAMEGTSDGIWDWDLATDEVYFNPRYYTMMGYEPGEFPGTYESWRRLLHPEDRERSEAAARRAIAERSAFGIEFRFRAKDGSWRWILARAKVVDTDPQGRALRMAGSHTDITDRKRAEETLHKYERIVSCSKDLMALIRRDYVYEAVNDSMLAAYGKTREEVVGRTIAALRGEETFQRSLRPWIDRALAGELVRYQMSFDYPTLGKRILDINYEPTRDDNGNVEGVVLNARDITETRKLEEQLVQSQKIESIGTLAGGVAHEINNPINGIMNYAQLICDQAGPDDPARQFAGEIIHETRRVAAIVRNLLTFARHEKHSHSSARLSDIVAAVLSLVQTVMRHDQIDLKVDIPEDLPAIKCRSQQIQQVLMNLMTNARDALNERYPGHSPEKRLNLFARVVVKEGQRFIRTTVEDTGAGIPAEIRERIFDPFFTTKPKENGTGLGLSISYGIIRDHGGQLRLESEAGQPTRFHVDLPVDNGWALPDKQGAANG